MHWQKAFDEAVSTGAKVAVCDRKGHMLAAANIHGHLITTIPAIMGDKWHEFVEDLDLGWFDRDDESEPLSYVQLGKDEAGKPERHVITLVKRRCDDVWICFGAVRKDPRQRPALHLELL